MFVRPTDNNVQFLKTELCNPQCATAASHTTVVLSRPAVVLQLLTIPHRVEQLFVQRQAELHPGSRQGMRACPRAQCCAVRCRDGCVAAQADEYHIVASMKELYADFFAVTL